LIVAVPAHGATRTSFCKPRHSKVLAHASGVRLIRVDRVSRADEYGVPVTLYACFPAKHRRVVLDSFDTTQSWTPKIIRITSRFVAYADQIDDVSCEKYAQQGCVSSSVTVRTLRTGKARCAVSSAADALALTSNGWAAWRVPGSGGAPSVLRACNSAGVQDLDSGNIDAASVRASGDMVSWTRDGQPQSAVLR
jgi:hypothetical protein